MLNCLSKCDNQLYMYDNLVLYLYYYVCVRCCRGFKLLIYCYRYSALSSENWQNFPQGSGNTQKEQSLNLQGLHNLLTQCYRLGCSALEARMITACRLYLTNCQGQSGSLTDITSSITPQPRRNRLASATSCMHHLALQWRLYNLLLDDKIRTKQPEDPLSVQGVSILQYKTSRGNVLVEIKFRLRNQPSKRR